LLLDAREILGHHGLDGRRRRAQHCRRSDAEDYKGDAHRLAFFSATADKKCVFARSTGFLRAFNWQARSTMEIWNIAVIADAVIK